MVQPLQIGLSINHWHHESLRVKIIEMLGKGPLTSKNFWGKVASTQTANRENIVWIRDEECHFSWVFRQTEEAEYILKIDDTITGGEEEVVEYRRIQI